MAANTQSSGDLTVQTLQDHLDGRLDDVRVYDEQLSAPQAAALYAQGSAFGGGEGGPQLVALYAFNEPDPVTPQLLSHWKLDEVEGGGGVIAAAGAVSLSDGAFIDSYRSSAGIYASGVNASNEAVVSTNSTDAGQVSGSGQIRGDAFAGPGANPSSVITASVTGTKAALGAEVDTAVPAWPLGLPASEGNQTFNGTQTWSTDRQFANLTLNNGGSVTIDGDVVLGVTGDLLLDGGVRINVNSGSMLTVYVQGSILMRNDAFLGNDSSVTDRVTLYGLDPTKLTTIQSPGHGALHTQGDVLITNGGRWHGQIRTAGDLTLNGGFAHLDLDLGLAAIDEIGVSDGAYIASPTLGLSGFGDGGTAVQFNGSDQYVEVPHDPQFLREEGSVSLWFRADDTSGVQVPFSRGGFNDGMPGYLGVSLVNSQLEAAYRGTGATHRVATASGAVSANQWYHLALNFSAQEVVCFLDGVQVFTGPGFEGGFAAAPAGGDLPLLLGAEALTVNNPSNFFDGRIDDVRFYDRTLNADQVADLIALTEPRAVVPDIAEDTSDRVPALDLTIADPGNVTWISGGGLSIDSATTVSSASAAASLHGALTDTDEVTIELMMTPLNVTQSGGQIVTYDTGPSLRNMRLTQTEDDVSFNLRTEFSSNGQPNLNTQDALEPGEPVHLVFVYDGQEMLYYRNGALAGSRDRIGGFDNWDDSYHLTLGSSSDGDSPWLGTLHRVAIYDGALNAVQAQNVFNGQAPGDGETGLTFEAEWLENP